MESKDRRRFKRYKFISEYEFSIGGKSFKASIDNYGLGGLCLSSKEISSLTLGAIIDIKIKDLNIDTQGKVVWAKKTGTVLKIGVEKSLISGRLRYFPLSDVLLDLQRSEKTGVLEMRNGPVCKKIYIKNGDMIFAASNLEEDRLGEVLLRAGRITLEQYTQSVDAMKKTGKRHGTALVELGHLKPKELIGAVTHQVEEILLSLFQWEDGEFGFIEGPLPTEEVITLKISAANLIYRGTKRINNFTYIKRACPPPDAILYYSADPLNLFQDIKLEEKDKGIFSLVDGSRKMEDILSLSPLDNFQTLKTLYSLLSARIIEVREKAPTKDEIREEVLKGPEVEVDPSFEERVEDLYNRLSSANYYNILGVTKWSTPDEIKGAYYKKAKEFHPDRHFHLSSETLKNKLNALFSHLTVAYKTLSDPKTKREYDKSLSSTGAPVKGSNTEMARARFQEGKTAFRKRSYPEAVALFGQAVYLDSSIADYHFYLALALGKEKKLREAEESINKALKLDPFNADYMAELGHIYLKLGLNSRAKASFEKAIKYNPSNERAFEGLQKIGKPS